MPITEERVPQVCPVVTTFRVVMIHLLRSIKTCLGDRTVLSTASSQNIAHRPGVKTKLKLTKLLMKKEASLRLAVF